jgi:lipopolysaccharide cholinephosphotransferase
MFRREWFDETVYLPFEFTTLPAPGGYDARLTKEYKDYMTPRQAPAFHTGTILDPDHPYTETVQINEGGTENE